MNFIMTPKDKQSIRRTLRLLLWLSFLLSAIAVVFASLYLSSRDFSTLEIEVFVTIPAATLWLIIWIRISLCRMRLDEMQPEKKQPEEQRGEVSGIYVTEEDIRPTPYNHPYNRLAEV